MFIDLRVGNMRPFFTVQHRERSLRRHGDELCNRLLRLRGHMRRDDGVRELQDRVVCQYRLLRQNIQSRTRDLSGLKSLDERPIMPRVEGSEGICSDR